MNFYDISNTLLKKYLFFFIYDDPDPRETNLF